MSSSLGNTALTWPPRLRVSLRKTVAASLVVLALDSLALPASAEVYGGFSVGGVLLKAGEGPTEGGFTLRGKLGGRGKHAGGYAALRGAAADYSGVTASWGSLTGGVDLFLDNGSAFYIAAGFARLTGKAYGVAGEVGTGFSLVAGTDIHLSEPLYLGIFIEHGLMDTNDVLLTDPSVPETFRATLLGLEATFQW